MERSSGILMHISSLPSPYGIGSLGASAYDFVDFLHASGQKYWQLLPLGPTGVGNSPYSSYSSFAGNPLLIDLDMLLEDGLLNREELDRYDWGSDSERVDFDKVTANREELLRLAFCRISEETEDEILAFRSENSQWLDNYALYMGLKKFFGGQLWTDWPEDIRKRWPNAIEYYSPLVRDELDYQFFLQYLFFKQWNRLRRYAAGKGISFIGDIPIYVALDSADVWSEPWFFQLDEQYRPSEVSGVPPDAFSEEGQLWGNPLYNYEAMRNDGYGWWIRRVGGAAKLYDMIRIDHFRGFESYWSVPVTAASAKEGKWVPGPGMDLVGRLTGWFKDTKFIAEDLGILTPEVGRLLRESGLPGMKILQFAFDASIESDYLPHRCIENSICYTGTHDNDTILGWLDFQNEDNISFAKKYMHISEDEGWNWGMIRTGMATVCHIFIAQMQDVLGLDGQRRMNVPGVANGNWGWRMLPDAIDDDLSHKLLDYTRCFHRTAKPEKAKAEAKE